MSYKKLVNDLLSECQKHCADCKYSKVVEFNCIIDKMAAFAIAKLLRKVERLEREKAELLKRAEHAERERDAAIKELDDVSSAVDDLSDFIDEKIFPTVQYDIYTSLRDNADAISMWKYEKDWRGTKEE